MRRAIGQSLRIGVSGQAVSLLRVSRWRLGRGGEAVTVLAEHAFPPTAEHPFDAIAQALRALLGELELGGWPVSFVLADELTRLWHVVPPAGASRLADIEAAAALRFQSLYGEAASAWHIAADWNARQPFFAAAMPRTLLAELRLVAQEYKLAVVAIEPHFVSAWNRWHAVLKPGAWYGVVHDKLLTIAAIGHGAHGTQGTHAAAIHSIRTLAVPNGADHYWLTQMLAREALLHDMEPPALLQACGALPAGWMRPPADPSHVQCVALEAQPPGIGSGDATAAPSPAVLLALGGCPR
jgi:hypothetical protein